MHRPDHVFRKCTCKVHNTDKFEFLSFNEKCGKTGYFVTFSKSIQRFSTISQISRVTTNKWGKVSAVNFEDAKHEVLLRYCSLDSCILMTFLEPHFEKVLQEKMTMEAMLKCIHRVRRKFERRGVRRYFWFLLSSSQAIFLQDYKSVVK